MLRVICYNRYVSLKFDALFYTNERDIMSKYVAGFLYVVYAAFLVFAIAFARPYYDDIYNFITGNITKISDVEVKSPTQNDLIIGKTYSFKYTVVGEYKNNAGLRFQSLDPDKMYVTTKGAVRGIDNGDESGEITARLRIYSSKDKDFEKIVTLTFKRVYPEKFSANYYVHSVGKNASKAYIGFPIKVYSTPQSGQSYSVTTYELVYDSEYFTLDEEKGLLIPIKTTPIGEKITVGVRYANGATDESSAFTILDVPEFSGFEEVRCNDTVLESFSIKQGASIVLTYYKDGKKQIVRPEITFTEGEGGSINQYGNIVFKTAGEKHVTLSAGEYTHDIVIMVRNEIVLPDMPDLDDALYDDKTVSLDYYDTVSFGYSFDKSHSYRTIKFEYDKSIIKVSSASGKIKIIPMDVGETKLKIYLDDGYERVEREFTVKVTGGKTTYDEVKHYITKNLYTILSKLLGHMTLFAILAPVCIFFAKTFAFEMLWQEVMFVLATSTPLAFLTEYIQSFIPGRYPAITDVMIDMSGFLIGSLITLLLIKAARSVTGDRY